MEAVERYCGAVCYAVQGVLIERLLLSPFFWGGGGGLEDFCNDTVTFMDGGTIGPRQREIPHILLRSNNLMLLLT